MRTRPSEAFLAVVASAVLSGVLAAAERRQPQKATGEDFFIVSSVDSKKKQLLLKRPTEVTELVLVNEKTTYRDEQGGPLRFTDLRAGDTIFVSSYLDAGGARVAVRIRKGAMTPEELRRRYLGTPTSTR